MIDWFSGYVGYDASNIELGRFLEFDPAGEIIRDRKSWTQARSSHETSIQVCSIEPTHRMLMDSQKMGLHCADQVVLRISGNPTKFLQGHNVYGPSVSQLGSLVQSTVRQLPERLRPRDCDVVSLPSVHRSRVDINVMIDLGHHDFVHEWIAAAGKHTRSKHGRAMLSPGTVSWGNRGTGRWRMKAYCKHCELAVHKPSVPDHVYGFMRDHTKGLLRLELELGRKELAPRGTLTEDIIWEFWNRITIGVGDSSMRQMLAKSNGTGLTSNTLDNEDVKAVKELGLTNRQTDILELWLAGRTEFRLSKSQFYAHRRAIYDATGLDISNPFDPDAIGPQMDLFGQEFLKARVVRQSPPELDDYLVQVA